MPVTLTAQEQLRCFEIARVIYSDSARLSDGLFDAGAVVGMGPLKTQLETFLAALSDDAKTEIKALVAEWELVRLDTTMLDGAIGSIQGVRSDPREARARIKEMFNIYVPVLTIWEYKRMLAQGASGTDTAMIPVLR